MEHQATRIRRWLGKRSLYLVCKGGSLGTVLLELDYCELSSQSRWCMERANDMRGIKDKGGRCAG